MTPRRSFWVGYGLGVLAAGAGAVLAAVQEARRAEIVAGFEKLRAYVAGGVQVLEHLQGQTREAIDVDEVPDEVPDEVDR